MNISSKSKCQLNLWCKLIIWTFQVNLSVNLIEVCTPSLDFLHRHRLLSTKLLSQEILQNRLFLSFKMFLEGVNTLLTCILSVAYRWRKMVLGIRFCFKDNHYFTIISSDGLVYLYLEIYPFTTGATTTGVIVAASIRYKVIFTNDT